MRLHSAISRPRSATLDSWRWTESPWTRIGCEGFLASAITRVTVSAVLGQLAAGASVDEVLVDYPYLERDDVLAALEYAATDAQERELQVAASS